MLGHPHRRAQRVEPRAEEMETRALEGGAQGVDVARGGVNGVRKGGGDGGAQLNLTAGFDTEGAAGRQRMQGANDCLDNVMVNRARPVSALSHEKLELDAEPARWAGLEAGARHIDLGRAETQRDPRIFEQGVRHRASDPEA